MYFSNHTFSGYVVENGKENELPLNKTNSVRSIKCDFSVMNLDLFKYNWLTWWRPNQHIKAHLSVEMSDKSSPSVTRQSVLPCRLQYCTKKYCISPNKRAQHDPTYGHTQINICHFGQSEDWIFWESLVTRTCNVWLNKVSNHFVGHQTSFQILWIR